MLQKNNFFTTNQATSLKIAIGHTIKEAKDCLPNSPYASESFAEEAENVVYFLWKFGLYTDREAQALYDKILSIKLEAYKEQSHKEEG